MVSDLGQAIISTSFHYLASLHCVQLLLFASKPAFPAALPLSCLFNGIPSCIGYVAMARTHMGERLNLVDKLHSFPVTNLGLDNLVRLATCNEANKSAIETVLVNSKLGLLDSALDSARCSEQQQQMQAAVWLSAVLLRKAQPATAAKVTERLLRLPSVPQDTAKQLVAAGLCIS
jgi:hypothetical protein